MFFDVEVVISAKLPDNILAHSSHFRLWYFVLWFSSCWSGVELRVMCPVCRMLQHPANRTHNPQLHTRPAT